MKKETKISQVISRALMAGSGGRKFTVRSLHSKLPAIGKNTISSYMSAFYKSFPNNVFRELKTDKKIRRGTYKYYEYELNGATYGIGKHEVINKVSNHLYKNNSKSKKVPPITRNEYPIYWYVAYIMLDYIINRNSFTTTDVLEKLTPLVPTVTKLRHITSYVTDIYRLSNGDITRTRPGSSYVYTGDTDYYRTAIEGCNDSTDLPFIMYDKQPTNTSSTTYTKDQPVEDDQAVEDFLKLGEESAVRMVNIQAGTITDLRKAIEQLKGANNELAHLLHRGPSEHDMWQLEQTIRSLRGDKTRLVTANRVMMSSINELTGTNSKRSIRVELPADAANGFVGASACVGLYRGNLNISLTVNNTKHQYQISKQELAINKGDISKPGVMVDGFTIDQYRRSGWTDGMMLTEVMFKPFIDAGLIKK